MPGVPPFLTLFGPPGERQVTYWIGREHWGRGVATAALAALIQLESSRPLHASAAADDAASIRVLEKCGFVVTGHGRDFARARDTEIDEVHLTPAWCGRPPSLSGHGLAPAARRSRWCT